MQSYASVSEKGTSQKVVLTTCGQGDAASGIGAGCDAWSSRVSEQRCMLQARKVWADFPLLGQQRRIHAQAKAGEWPTARTRQCRNKGMPCNARNPSSTAAGRLKRQQRQAECQRSTIAPT